MKRPELCQMNVKICEDCRYWEPIPFHDEGGACIPPVEVPVARLIIQAPASNMEKVPVKV